MNITTAARKSIVRSINTKLAPTHFLVAKRERAPIPPCVRVYASGRWLVSYWVAVGDPKTARYEVSDAPVDLAELARLFGIALTSTDLDAVEPAAVAA
jgi:hypothetical protein